jgi:hypothetical protein
MVPVVAFPPGTLSTDQSKVELPDPGMLAVNCWVVEGSTVATLGEIVKFITVIAALALPVALATLAAIAWFPG